ncbi:MAG: hypothetical protein V2B17_06380 [Chloroflexota bacterium]
MFDQSTPLQVPGRVADRMIEMQSRRLAAEARAGITRTHWLADELRSAIHSGAALLTRLRHLHVRLAPRLSPGHDRA